MQGGGAGKAKVLTSSGSIKLGTDAGLNLLSTDTNNIAIGTDTLKTGHANASTDNIAIGTSALSAITSGDSNVGIGTGAGAATEDKSNNVFIGKNVANVGSTIQKSTFIGSLSGEDVSTSGAVDMTTWIGYSACSDALGGSVSGDVVIGAHAAAESSGYLGYQNAIIGYKAGYEAAGGAYQCTFIGTHSGYGCSSASDSNLTLIGAGSSVGPTATQPSGSGYPGQIGIASGNVYGIKRYCYGITMSGSYTNADTDNRAAKAALCKFPQYSFISRVIVRVVTLGAGTHKYNISMGTASNEDSGDVVAGRVELLGAGTDATIVTRSQGALTSETDIDASSGVTDEMVWISNINPETDSSAGWCANDMYLYVCHAGTGNATSDPGTDPKLEIIVEWY